MIIKNIRNKNRLSSKDLKHGYIDATGNDYKLVKVCSTGSDAPTGR